MKIISWNINSVRLRLPLLLNLLQETTPDIICLQETKAPDEHFPSGPLAEAGYNHQAFRGEKSYNGVAILSKLSFSNKIQEDFGGNDQSRHIGVTLESGEEVHNFYIPAGGDEPDTTINPKFAHKLQFVKDLTHWSSQQKRDRKQLIMGDFNIAPLEHDVWSSKQLRKVVSHTDIERELLGKMQQAGNWVDTHRHITPADEKLYSWWSYRARDWEASDRGRRLDHLWASPKMAELLKSTEILKSFRGKEKPSDHAPIMANFSA
jgi:exodeoxyribonuclease-3